MREELKKRTSEGGSGCRKLPSERRRTSENHFEAMNYSVRAGGKRLRPMLMEETYHLFGGTERARALYGSFHGDDSHILPDPR